MRGIHEYCVPDILSQRIKELVEHVYDDCPGESEYRYICRLNDIDLSEVREHLQPQYLKQPALHATNLPSFPLVQQSKILALLLGEVIGKCVAYSDYNHSFITDIRPTNLSKEASANDTLLRPHSDLAFADDDCRPHHLVLVPHKIDGDMVKTLVAPAKLIDEALSNEERSILREGVFEVTAGMRLAWRHLRITRLAVLSDHDDQVQIRYDLGGLRPLSALAAEKQELAIRAVRALEEVALQIGRQFGVEVKKGQALFISNNHCLHGRAELDPSRTDRLLLRSYVVPPDIVRHHHNRMIALGH